MARQNTGERKSKTTWHKIKVLNNSLIENVIRPYVNKGSLIGIEGELDNEEWEKDGQKRQATKVVVGAFGGSLYLLGSKDDNGGDRNSRGRDDDRGSRSSGRYSNDDRGNPPAATAAASRAIWTTKFRSLPNGG